MTGRRHGAPTRTVAIALGEAPANLADAPHVGQPLPALQRLAALAATGTTMAPQPLDSSTLWATLVTGRTPGAHGVFGPLRALGPGRSRRVRRDDLAQPPVWRLLEDAGRAVGTFNVTFSDPSRTGPSRGFVVAHDSRRIIQRDLVHPPELFTHLTGLAGRWATGSGTLAPREWTESVPDEIAARTTVLLELLRTRQWDFSLVHLQAAARAQHRFWGDDGDTLASVYGATDRAIGAIVDAVGPDTNVFVFSECGAGPIRHSVHLDVWLEEQGYLHRRRGPRPRLGLMVARGHRHVRTRLPRSPALTPIKAQVRAAITSSNIDWPRTRAYCLGDTNEIHFAVPDEARRPLAEELRPKLLAMRDPENRPVVEDVIPRSAWRGPSEYAPDLLIVWADDAYMSSESFDDDRRVFSPWRPEFPDWTFTGCHRRTGMLLATGPGIAPGDIGEVDLVDLVPTWLDLLGVEIPPDLAGTSFAGRLRHR